MKRFLLLLITNLLQGSSSTPDEDRLHRYLFDPEYQQHNVMTTPANGSDEVLEVAVGIGIRKVIAVEEVEEVLKLQYRLFYRWKDLQLTWNASEFGNVARVFRHSSKLWTPDLLVTNNAKLVAPNEITPQSNVVTISSDGLCIWEPRFELSITQVFSRRYVVSVRRAGVPSRFRVVGALFVVAPSTVRIHTTTTTEVNVYHYPTITFTLHLRRRPIYYVVNLVIPCCLLSFISVATFLLQPSCSERLGLTVTILLAMTVYQIIVTEKLPSSSTSIPVIVLYFTFAICMCVVAVVFTIVVLRMYLHAETKPIAAMPAWMKHFLCKKVAFCLCMKLPPSASLEPPLLYRNSRDVSTSYCDNIGPQHHSTLPDVAGKTKNQSTERYLKRMCELMETKRQKEQEESYQAARENELKNEWMLAAAVLDRICTIAFSVVFIGGTAVFIAVVASRDN